MPVFPGWPAKYVLRPMIVADIESVLEIERRSIPSAWKASGYKHELTKNNLAHYWVLVLDGQLIGYAGYWLIGPEAQISIIAVHPGWRGQGLGKLLLLHLLADAFSQEANEITLEVRQGNNPAQSLYVAHGFEEVGLRRGYYKDTGEDAVLMTLVMDPEIFPAVWQQHYEHLVHHLLGEGS